MRETTDGQVALYERVSTDKQNPENQEPDLRKWAKKRGFKIAAVYVDRVSGAKKSRPQLAEALAGAHRGEFHAVMIWALDRLSREGVEATLKCLRQFEQAGVRVMSYQQPWLDTGGPMGELLVSFYAWMAAEERRHISERTKAAMQRLRDEEGRQFGRPPLASEKVDAIRTRLKKGESIRTVALSVGVGHGSVQRLAATMPKTRRPGGGRRRRKALTAKAVTS